MQSFRERYPDPRHGFRWGRTYDEPSMLVPYPSAQFWFENTNKYHYMAERLINHPQIVMIL